MRSFRSLRSALGAWATVAIVAGCSAGTQQSASVPYAAPLSTAKGLAGVPLARTGERSAATPGGLYVAQFGVASVPEFGLPDTSNHGPRCSDTVPPGGINGIAVNAHRTLYVPYEFSGSFIATFAPNCGAAGTTLADPNGEAGDVAFNNSNNTVYASDEDTGGIDVYVGGATSPTRSLSNNQHPGNGLGVAVDSHGNVFNSGPTIVEFPNGANKGSKALHLTGLSSPQGLAFDVKNNLIVTNGNNIKIYAPPYNGAPTRTIKLGETCLYSALDASNTNLYVSDLTKNSVDVYAYASGKFKYRITSGFSQSGTVSGVAVDPPSKT